MRYFVSFLVILVCVNGCAISDIQRTNQRLKKENDDLLRENRELKTKLQFVSKEQAEWDIEKAELLEQIETLKLKLGSPDTASAPKEITTTDFDKVKGIEVEADPSGIRLTGVDEVFFKPGVSAINDAGRKILDEVVSILKTKYPTAKIKVSGHTDSTPIKHTKDRYASNWELSAERACAVVRYLQQKGLPPEQLTALGHAYYKPVASNATEEGKKQNRRVEILVQTGG
jgi:flagellar motor protein MotB